MRAQDPAGPYAAPMLRLLEGRYPAGADEVAVTGRVAPALRAGVGGRFDLDGRAYTVVGLVENPGGQIGALTRVPLAQLGFVALGVPLAAAAAGWILAAREPRSLARIRLE